MRKFMAFIFIVFSISLVIGMSSCTKEKIPQVGITTIIEHPALNSVIQGFKDSLSDAGYKEGSTISYDSRNAQGSMENAVQIAAGFVGNNVDLILAVGTPVAKAAAEQTDTLPIVIAAITDPVASGLVQDPKHPGGNITGTSDKVPVEEQFKLIKKLLPKTQKIGVVYNPGEPNSVIIIDVAREAAKKLGLTLIEATANKTSEVRSAAASLIGKIDAMYLTTDNTTAAAIQVINDVCNENNIPFISSEKESLKTGTLAFLGIDYYEVGRDAGNTAIRILKGEKPGNIPISYPKKFALAVNKKAADRLNVKIPEDILKNAEIIE
jgi:putative ABC transport system substrate-binding protein